MAKVNPKEHKDTYEHQDKIGDAGKPPSGTYHFVNCTLQRALLSTGTKKISIKARVLKSLGSNDDQKIWVGKDVYMDMWMDMTKDANMQRLVCMGIACNQTDEWDPDEDADMVKALTDQPYIITVETSQREYKGKMYDDMKIMDVRTLSPKERDAYRKGDPNWSKVVPAADKRMLKEKEEKRKEGGSNGGGGKQTGATDPFRDDDVPH